MGNSSSSGRGHHDETVDYGALVPQGVYTGPRDWNQAIVSQLIVARRLAPYYRPLEDYDESWDDDQILAARKELPDPDNADSVTRIEATASPSNGHRTKRPASLKEPSKLEAQVYRGAVECPICFLYYPPNINHSRCCDQAICTECFVQIKRAEPTATHLVSEPAACPYCVQDNFGVVYNPPPWRAGLGSEGSSGLWADPPRSTEPTAPPTHKRRQKSFSADSPEVVTTDQIRPDWEAKLEAVRAAVARRANRRIIMRQVGDRLIPVGVTSGRVHALTPEEAAAAGADASGGSRRSRRRQQGGGQFEQYMNIAGQDLEEMMLMEAMRLSLLDHEEHQRKEAEEKKKQEAAAAAAAAAAGGTPPATEAANISSESPSPGPGPSTLEARSSIPSSSSLLPSRFSIGRSSSPSSRAHDRVDSQDSLQPGRRSWSISRSRTPSPPLPNPAGNVPTSEENQAAWRSRSTNPPAFSTLSAALTSTSTAAAFLGTPPSSQPRPVTPSGTSSTAPATSIPAAIPAPIPTITIANDSAPVARAIPPVETSTTSPSSIPTSTNPFLDPFRDPESPTSATSNVNAGISPTDVMSVTSSESGESGAGIGLGLSGNRMPFSEPVHERSDSDLAKVGEAPATACLEEVSSL
ncbi:hypothetical protein BDN70DRAFT_871933 [Pholiota conissans]|uniref:RING-type domain-containing protein n=1 Tax=Pholiota conissans TaxID=109636 RepID=A0A9P6CZ86_9AGAR|nr:hypothetical protein BDN70DRAFT_871933 [Pholiota conissans]